MPMVSSRLCLCCSDVGALPLRAWKIVLSISASIPGLDHSQPQLPVPRTLLRFVDSKNPRPARYKLGKCSSNDEKGMCNKTNFTIYLHIISLSCML